MEEELLNPLKRLRIQELNRTPEQVAKEAGCQLAAIGQAEDGFYVNPLPAYLQVLGIIPGTQEYYDITEEYHEYQNKKRISSGPNGVPRLILSPEFFLTEHPLVSWRNQSDLSTYGFCSAFCVHMPSVNNFERNILSMTKVPPTSIEGPLLVAGYDLSEFKEACVLFKENCLRLQRQANGL